MVGLKNKSMTAESGICPLSGLSVWCYLDKTPQHTLSLSHTPPTPPHTPHPHTHTPTHTHTQTHARTHPQTHTPTHLLCGDRGLIYIGVGCPIGSWLLWGKFLPIRRRIGDNEEIVSSRFFRRSSQSQPSCGVRGKNIRVCETLIIQRQLSIKNHHTIMYIGVSHTRVSYKGQKCHISWLKWDKKHSGTFHLQ